MAQSIDVIIRISRGTRNKYEYDHDLHVVKLNRHLTSSMGYPAEDGFFPNTLGGDGDPLDVLVLTEYPTFPGCVVEVRVVGALFMIDEHGDNAKLIAVPAYDPQWKAAKELSDIPSRKLDEINHFFCIQEPGCREMGENKGVRGPRRCNEGIVRMRSPGFSLSIKEIEASPVRCFIDSRARGRAEQAGTPVGNNQKGVRIRCIWAAKEPAGSRISTEPPLRLTAPAQIEMEQEVCLVMA